MKKEIQFKMPNSNYIKGRRKEYKIVNELKQKGYDIVQRTAGSHSPIDIIAINKDTAEILFIQSKPDTIIKKRLDEINKENEFLNKIYNCKFIVL